MENSLNEVIASSCPHFNPLTLLQGIILTQNSIIHLHLNLYKILKLLKKKSYKMHQHQYKSSTKPNIAQNKCHSYFLALLDICIEN